MQREQATCTDCQDPPVPVNQEGRIPDSSRVFTHAENTSRANEVDLCVLSGTSAFLISSLDTKLKRGAAGSFPSRLNLLFFVAAAHSH